MDWLPGAERLPSSHAGGSMAGGPPRVVWHRTAGNDYAGNAAYLRAEGFEPHLLWDPWTGQIGQFLPAAVSAYALRHAGGPETNRAGQVCIQIEVADRGSTVDITATPMVGLDRIMAWLDGHGIPRTWPAGPPAPLGVDSKSRDPQVWTTRAGHYGHCDVPGNDHTDPGRIDLARLFGTAPPTEELTDMDITQITAAVTAAKNEINGNLATVVNRIVGALRKEVEPRLDSIEHRLGAVEDRLSPPTAAPRPAQPIQ